MLWRIEVLDGHIHERIVNLGVSQAGQPDCVEEN